MNHKSFQLSFRMDQDTKEKLNQLFKNRPVKKSRNQFINDLIKKYYERNFSLKSTDIEAEILEIMYNENQNDVFQLIKENEEFSYELIKTLDWIFNNDDLKSSVMSKEKRENFYRSDKDIDY